MKLLEGKVSIVTGAARGIGAAIALKLAEQGSHIVFTYVSDNSAEKAAALATQIEALGGVTLRGASTLKVLKVNGPTQLLSRVPQSVRSHA